MDGWIDMCPFSLLLLSPSLPNCHERHSSQTHLYVRRSAVRALIAAAAVCARERKHDGGNKRCCAREKEGRSILGGAEVMHERGITLKKLPLSQAMGKGHQITTPLS